MRDSEKQHCRTYEITDKWVLNAQKAQKKYNISPRVYVALKTQVSEIESVKDRNGETIANSKGLLIMQAIYNTPGLSEKQRNALFEYLGVGKSIRHYNKALVRGGSEERPFGREITKGEVRRRQRPRDIPLCKLKLRA